MAKLKAEQDSIDETKSALKSSRKAGVPDVKNRGSGLRCKRFQQSAVKPMANVELKWVNNPPTN